MFTKVPKSTGEVLVDDLVEEAMRDAMKVRKSSFLSVDLSYALVSNTFFIIGHS